MKRKYVQPAVYAVEMEGDFCANATSSGTLSGSVGLGRPGSIDINNLAGDDNAASTSVWDNTTNE